MQHFHAEHYATPREARQRVLTLRAQGIAAVRSPDTTAVTCGADYLAAVRQATTVVWPCFLAE